MTVEWHLTKTASIKNKDYFIFTSISANPAVVNRYFNKSWLRVLFDSSFSPVTRINCPEGRILPEIRDRTCGSELSFLSEEHVSRLKRF